MQFSNRMNNVMEKNIKKWERYNFGEMEMVELGHRK